MTFKSHFSYRKPPGGQYLDQTTSASTSEKDTKNSVTWWCITVPTIPMEAIRRRNTPHAMNPPITEISTMYAIAFAYAATPMRTNATTYKTHVYKQHILWHTCKLHCGLRSNRNVTIFNLFIAQLTQHLTKYKLSTQAWEKFFRYLWSFEISVSISSFLPTNSGRHTTHSSIKLQVQNSIRSTYNVQDVKSNQRNSGTVKSPQTRNVRHFPISTKL